MSNLPRSEIGLQYNIAEAIIRSAEARGLEAMATGGGFDFITRALGDKSTDPRLVLACADDAGSPHTLSDLANVTLYLNDEDWSDGGFISFNFDNTVEALDFMAGFNDVFLDLKGRTDAPLSCRSCGRTLGTNRNCEECASYPEIDMVAIAKKTLGIDSLLNNPDYDVMARESGKLIAQRKQEADDARE